MHSLPVFADAYNWAGQHLEELFRPRLGPCRLFSKSSESAAVNHHCGRHAGVACNKKRTVFVYITQDFGTGRIEYDRHDSNLHFEIGVTQLVSVER